MHQQLHRFDKFAGRQGVLDVIRALSYVQIDTISVIERAHHHTLYNRVPDYDPGWLDKLLAEEKAIWEYWAHAASYIPLADYPWYKYRMQRFPNGSWEKRFWELHKDLAKPVLKRIRQEGPLSARDFEDTRTNRSAEPWGNLKPAKIMLELLMWKGDLIVTSRNRFQRVYDLTERVIPDHSRIKTPAEADRAEFMIKRTLQAHGIVCETDINNHIRLAPRAAVNKALHRMIKAQAILPVHIEGLKEKYYIRDGANSDLQAFKPVPERLHILSPFDNAVILRDRLRKLFDFDYALECYVTPSKRQYGYWNCPILWRNEFTGILDPKADRKTGTLIINSIRVKNKAWMSKKFRNSLEKELERFAAFNACHTYSLDKVIPM